MGGPTLADVGREVEDDELIAEMIAATRLPWVAGLLGEVDAAFETTGAATPGWPDPHPDRDALDEEYSRCLDPRKYRILNARVEAWARVLSVRGLARVVDPPSAEEHWLDAVRRPSELSGVRLLDPVREDAVAVLLATAVVDGDEFGLDVGLRGGAHGAPSTLVELLPDCGCDACDVGSEPLLEELDESLLTVLRGGVLHVRHRDASVTRTWDGSRGSGWRADLSWLRPDAELPDGARRWAGEPWL